MRSGTASVVLSGLFFVSRLFAGQAAVPVVSSDFRAFPAGFPFLPSPQGILVLTREEGLFLLGRDGGPRLLLRPSAPAAVPAFPCRDGVLLFLEDGSLLRVADGSTRTRHVDIPGHAVVAAVCLPDIAVVFLTDDGVLHRLDPDAEAPRPFGFTPQPWPDAFLVLGDVLLVRSGVSQWLRFRLPGLVFLGYTNLRPAPSSPWVAKEGLLYRRDAESGAWGVVAELPTSAPAAWVTTNGGRLYYASADGHLRVYVLTPSAGLSPPPVQELRPGWAVSVTPDGAVLSGPCGRWELPCAPPAVESCVDALCEDLDGDGRADAALLFDANRTLSYRRVLLAFSSSAGQEFTTILATDRGLGEVLRDLDGDGRKELVLTKEMALNLDVRLDRRLLVPEVYRNERGRGFVWASHRYPGFHRAQAELTRRRLRRAPFASEEKNRLWRRMNAVILALQTETVTLHRQIRQAESRPRDARSRAGLSLWYYKRGLELFRNRWDNLALLAFRHSLEQDPSNRRAAFQAGRIYAEYGLFEEARRMLERGRASDIVFVANQNYYRMKEDLFPVLFDPPVFYRHYHAGEVLFATGDYGRAAAEFRRALSVPPPEGAEAFRQKARLLLADALMALQRFEEAAELYALLERLRPGPETAHKLRLARRLNASR